MIHLVIFSPPMDNTTNAAIAEEALIKSERADFREILIPRKVWKTREYWMYFLFFKLRRGSKRSTSQPQTIYSEVP